MDVRVSRMSDGGEIFGAGINILEKQLRFFDLGYCVRSSSRIASAPGMHLTFSEFRGKCFTWNLIWTDRSLEKLRLKAGRLQTASVQIKQRSELPEICNSNMKGFALLKVYFRMTIYFFAAKIKASLENSIAVWSCFLLFTKTLHENILETICTKDRKPAGVQFSGSRGSLEMASTIKIKLCSQNQVKRTPAWFWFSLSCTLSSLRQNPHCGGIAFWLPKRNNKTGFFWRENK